MYYIFLNILFHWKTRLYIDFSDLYWLNKHKLNTFSRNAELFIKSIKKLLNLSKININKNRFQVSNAECQYIEYILGYVISNFGFFLNISIHFFFVEQSSIWLTRINQIFIYRNCNQILAHITIFSRRILFKKKRVV